MSKKMRLMLFITMLLVLVSNLSGQVKFSVAGIVVDEQGKPIPGAIASIYPYPYKPCKGCHDELFFRYRANEEGVFFLDSDYDKARVLIKSPVPKGFWDPVGSLINDLSCFPEFRGEIVETPKEAPSVWLGKILPHVRYRVVSINLAELFDEEVFRGDWTLRLSIEYKGVRVINNEVVKEKAIDRQRREVRFVLPVGTWDLTFKVAGVNGESTKVKQLSVQ